VFNDKVSLGVEHFKHFQKYANTQTKNDPIFYEYGAGWDLLIPFTYAALGVKKQILVDITHLLHFDLINDTIKRINENISYYKDKFDCKMKKLDPSEISSLEQLEDIHGIQYIAPADARKTPLDINVVDFISTTTTLEHIPEKDLRLIEKENFRILKKGGIVSEMIDLQDHYSHFDKSINIYNYLIFSDKQFRLFNSGVLFQNRLRYPEYIRIFEESEFEIVMDVHEKPDMEKIQLLKRMNIHPMFSNFATEELGIYFMRIVALK